MTSLGHKSGFDVPEVHLQYDYITDTFYAGIVYEAISGDANGDGDPGHDSLVPETAADWPDMSGSETFSFEF